MRPAILFFTMLFCLSQAGAGILFDQERNAIRISDYPPVLPCTLAQLAVADKTFGWNKIRYDQATTTYHIDCNLIIGANDGTETVLQIGAEDCPRETLVLRGNIFIHPYFIQGRNPGLYYRAPKLINALQLGQPNASNITAHLLLACATNEHYTLYCGYLPWIKAEQYGGGIYVFGGEISAADPAYPIGDAETGNMFLGGSSVFDGARLAHVKGALYGLQMGGVNKDYLLKNTIFERIGTPLQNGTQKATSCQFINCGTALMDWGCLKAELTDCIFKNNNRNWELVHTDDGLILIDCEWDAPHQADLYQARQNRAGKMQHPKLSVRRSIVVEVHDAAGKPVKGAEVSFKAEQAGCDLIQHRTFKTDAEGRTPARGAAGAIILTEYIKTAAAHPAQPTLQEFTYTITAAHKNQTNSITGIRPSKNGEKFLLLPSKSTGGELTK